MSVSPKQKLLFRMRKTARHAASARLGGYMFKAREYDDAIERIYSEAKRNGWREGPFVLAEEKGRQEAARFPKWYGAIDRVSKRRPYLSTRGTTKYRDARRGRRRRARGRYRR